MPLFSRSSFRTPKKPPKRRSESLPNIPAQLEDSMNLTVDTMKLEGGTPAVSMKLGGCDINFEDGQWVVGKFFLNRAHQS